MKFQLLIKNTEKYILFFLLSDVVFIMLINVKQVSYLQEDKQVMKQCINMALNLPDFSYREKDGKYVHIKHFKFSVGHLGLLNAQQIRSKLCSVLNSTISLSFQHFHVHNT